MMISIDNVLFDLLYLFNRMEMLPSLRSQLSAQDYDKQAGEFLYSAST